MAIRCKMRLDNIFRNEWGGLKAFFSCQYDQRLAEEDRAFQKATPSGSAEYIIDNPKAQEQLIIGRYYYVDFHPIVPAAEEASAAA